MNDLPELTAKQQQFVMQYVLNGNNATEAYRSAYDCTKMSKETVNVEACKMLKNPKVTLWVEQYKSNVQKVFDEELKYSAQDCFDELSEVQERARKAGRNYQHEIKAIELKGKLAGRFTEKHQISGENLADVLDRLK